MQQGGEKICSMCGKTFDLWDEQEDFCFVRHIGYGSKYDMKGLYLNLCCDCFDKIADWFLPLCANDPLVDEQDHWRPCSSERDVSEQFMRHMKDGVKELSEQLDGISVDADDFRLRLKKAADALRRLSDRVQFEMKSFGEGNVQKEEAGTR